MPEYLYSHPKTGKIVSVIQKMTDKHVFFDEKGVEYKRVFVNGQINTSSTLNIDPYSSSDFSKKTENIKGGTLGNLFDLSAELSAKRAQKDGIDHVKEKSMGEYEKRTQKRSPFRPKQVANVDFAKKTIKID